MMTELQDEKIQESSSHKTQEKPSLCDFCNDFIAVLYCRADSAKLCLKCDRKVHSTNQLFTKHTRLVLCDACDASPSSIFCSTHCSVLCQNCDWESHRISESSVHDRRPLEGFSGCPSVPELLAIFGFDDLGKKKNKNKSKCDGLDESENYGFSDYLIWETPSVISLDDLISSDGSDHNFQAMGLPPLPKNRNTVCGQRKEEILCQLREMAKLEPGSDQFKQDLEPSSGFQSLVPDHDCQQLKTSFESKTEPTFFPPYEASDFQWCNDISEDAEESMHDTSFQSYFNTDYLVPDKKYNEIDPSLHHDDNKRDTPSKNPIVAEASQIFSKVASHEFSSQHRDSAINRYKEKRKSRRYEKHIRYESRKVRAESRARIKGRFAKVDR